MMEQWNNGILEYWNIGRMEYWNIGMGSWKVIEVESYLPTVYLFASFEEI